MSGPVATVAKAWLSTSFPMQKVFALLEGSQGECLLSNY